MSPLVVILVFVGAILWHATVFRLAPRLGLVKPNFKKQPVMASYGVVSFGYAAAVIALLGLFRLTPWPHARLYLWVMATMCILGLIDDIWGSREVGGFLGHFRRLLKEGRLTTGVIKAVGGGAVGIWAGYSIADNDPIKWSATALLIPLCANLLNLVDLRPGRAGAVFFFALGVTYIAARATFISPWVVAAVAVVALAWTIPDSLGKAMMGDAGSNYLGAAVGITMAINTGLVFQWICVAIIVALHLCSEKYSFSDLIERNRVLRRIDRKLGVR